MEEVDGSYIAEVESQTMNPLDLFVSSTDTLHHGQIDHVIPENSGWSTRPTRRSGVLSHSRDNSRESEREEVRALCRRGIPGCLRWWVGRCGVIYSGDYISPCYFLNDLMICNTYLEKMRSSWELCACTDRSHCICSDVVSLSKHLFHVLSSLIVESNVCNSITLKCVSVQLFALSRMLCVLFALTLFGMYLRLLIQY